MIETRRVNGQVLEVMSTNALQQVGVAAAAAILIIIGLVITYTVLALLYPWVPWLF